MGNDLFLNAGSKKEKISNSKQKKVLVIVSKTITMKISLTTRKAENVMLLESMICLFSNMGNDLFLSAESKKEEISNSKTSF